MFSPNEETLPTEILLVTTKWIGNSRNGTQYLMSAFAEIHSIPICQNKAGIFERLYNL